MVEQEYSKGSAVFPESLVSNISSKKYSDTWFANEAIMQKKSEEFSNSDFLNIELLYGSVLSADETFTSPLLSSSTKERGNILFQDTMPNDIFSTNDSAPYDLYYNDSKLSCIKDYWHPMTEKMSPLSDSCSEANSPLSFWGSCPLDLETLKMDDVFQVDKDDLVQSPTLAELNANDESLFDSFDTFDIPLPSEQKLLKSSLTTTCSNTDLYKIPSQTDLTQIKIKSDLPCGKDDIDSETGVSSSFNLEESKIDPLASEMSITPSLKPNVTPQVISKLTRKSYPTTDTIDEKPIERDSDLNASSNCDAVESEEDDSEMDCDYSTDIDDESEDDVKVHSSKQTATKTLLLQKKKSRYFWQYNIQSKGPKAPKMKIDDKSNITDNFSGISDPVFTSSYLVKGIKHAGKARRGDGNDLTPNPQKLYNIGVELEKLTSVIEGLIPANELPLNARSKSRKEKNKLASRACRLKKKAQHEANKLKLFGLQKEQKHLLSIINEVKKIIRKSVENMKHGKVHSVHNKVEAMYLKKGIAEVAGYSAEFVNNVLKNVDMGDKTGGLDFESLDE